MLLDLRASRSDAGQALGILGEVRVIRDTHNQKEGLGFRGYAGINYGGVMHGFSGPL